MSIFAELQPIYLTGNFSLSNSDNGWDIEPQKQIEIGSWKNMGYPFYYDKVSYVKTVFFTEIPEKLVIQLGEWDGTVAEVLVNNQMAGIIQQPPYQHEIRKDLIEGENHIEVIVYSSLKNLLGPHHGIMDASFSRGMVRPPSFKSGPEKRPPGIEYDLLDYGLHEEFEVYVSN